MNLIIGKNNTLIKALEPWLVGKYISHSEIDLIDYAKYDTLFLLSFPPEYKKNFQNNFLFEKKILSKFHDKKIYYFSTSKVYEYKINCKETSLIMPNSFYSENKYKIENIVKEYTEKYFIIRLSNVFSRNLWAQETFLDILYKNFHQKNLIKFDVSFQSIRDFVTIDSIRIVLMNLSNNDKYGIYNLGSEKGNSIEFILKKCLKDYKYDEVTKFEGSIILNQTLNIDKICHALSINKSDIFNSTLSELDAIKF